MDLNASLVKTERLNRSWTQQHLADACSVSLRTVQRVERFGNASPDTIMGLCSVLNLKPDDLVIIPDDTEEDAENGLLSVLSATGVIPLVMVAIILGVMLGGMATYWLMSA